MNKTIIITLLILSHVIADFYLQSTKIAFGKKKNKIMLLYHCLIVLSVSTIITVFYFDLRILLTVLLITAIHSIIDLIKILLEQKTKINKILLFISDQLIHIFLIIIFVTILPFSFTLNSTAQNLLISIKNIFTNMASIKAHHILLFTLYLYTLRGGSILVSLYLEGKPTVRQETEMKKGETAGLIERFLILTLMIMKMYYLIPFVISLKIVFILFKKDTTSNQPQALSDGQVMIYSFPDKCFISGTILSVIIPVALGIIYTLLVTYSFL